MPAQRLLILFPFSPQINATHRAVGWLVRFMPAWQRHIVDDRRLDDREIVCLLRGQPGIRREIE